MKQVLSALCAFALIGVACSPAPTDANKDGIADGIQTPNSVSVVAPSMANGTLSGQAVDAKLKPLADVAVTLVLGKADGNTSVYNATSNAEGVFAMRGLPAPSTGQLIFTKAGFGTVRTSVSIGGVVGNFPANDANTNVGQVGLFELNSTFKVQVYTASGRAARGAKAYLEVASAGFVVLSGAYGTAQGVVSLEGAVDDTGLLTISGLPNLTDMTRISLLNSVPSIQLTILGIDDDMDGRFEFAGTTTSYSASELLRVGTTPIVLNDNRVNGTVRIVATNIASLTSASLSPLRNIVKGSEPITVLFNQPVQQASLQVKLVDENCSAQVMATTTLRNGVFLTITPAAAWVPGREYNLAVRAIGTDTNVAATMPFSATGFLFGGDPATPVAPDTMATFVVKKSMANMMTSKMEPGDQLYVNFSVPLIRAGSTAQAKVFVNTDLNGNGMVGGMNDNGEFNSNTSTIVIDSAELLTDTTMTNTFGCVASQYTTRFSVPVPVPPMGIPTGTQFRIVLPKDVSTTNGYQTIWGVPVTGEITGQLTIGQ